MTLHVCEMLITHANELMSLRRDIKWGHSGLVVMLKTNTFAIKSYENEIIEDCHSN